MSFRLQEIGTPTGAAAIILRDKSEIRSELQGYMTRLGRAMGSVLDGMRHSFDLLDSKLGPQSALDDLEMRSMQVEELSKAAESSVLSTFRDMRNQYMSADARLRPSRALEDISGLRRTVEVSLERIQASSRHMMDMGAARLQSVSGDPEQAVEAILNDANQRLGSDSKQLEGLNPSNVLTRGYSMITDKGGRVLTSIERINVGDSIVVRLRDGSAGADITSKELKE